MTEQERQEQRNFWLREGSLPIFFRPWQITCKPKEGKKKEGGTPTMKRVLRKIIDNAVPLWYAKDKDMKIRLSRAVAIHAAQFLKLYCEWKITGECRSCPFLKSPEGYCMRHVAKPDEWELPESETNYDKTQT